MKLTPVFAIAAALLLNACAPITRVILLPQADGSASSVVLKTTQGEQVLTTPYQLAWVKEDTPMILKLSSDAEVQKIFPSLFTAKPPAPTKYILNFMPGGTDLTPESKAALPKILGDTSQRKGADLVVTGHTDTTGALLANDELSLKRAEVVTKLLVDSGAPAARIESVGRGKRELLIKTEDNVDEPQNRRVEILVR